LNIAIAARMFAPKALPPLKPSQLNQDMKVSKVTMKTLWSDVSELLQVIFSMGKCEKKNSGSDLRKHSLITSLNGDEMNILDYKESAQVLEAALGDS
jgi:hypothetical protein